VLFSVLGYVKWQCLREWTLMIVWNCQSMSGVKQPFLARFEVFEAAMIHSCVNGLVFHDVLKDR
jgi:hypothetical protein